MQHNQIVYVVAPFVVGFAALGFRRGWLREVVSLAGLLACWLMVAVFGGALVGLANRLVLMFLFTVRGGFDRAIPDRCSTACARRHSSTRPDRTFFSVC